MTLFFDTETTGKYNFNASHTDPSQPHLVQLGAVLHDENRQLVASINLIVKPEGWTIPVEASNVHGITTEHALKHGVPMAIAMAAFSNLVKLSELVVAHNIQFDAGMMAAEFHRLGKPNPLEEKEQFCTMQSSTDIVKIPGRYNSYKWPNLQEAHKFFTGEGFDGAHDAMVDVLACARVYYALQDLLVAA